MLRVRGALPVPVADSGGAVIINLSLIGDSAVPTTDHRQHAARRLFLETWVVKVLNFK